VRRTTKSVDAKRWDRWLSNLSNLSKLRIARCFKTNNFGKWMQSEIHAFSDSTMRAYDNCFYLRMIKAIYDKNNKYLNKWMWLKLCFSLTTLYINKCYYYQSYLSFYLSVMGKVRVTPIKTAFIPTMKQPCCRFD